LLLEEGALREGGVLHLADLAGGLDLEEHEAPVVLDALGGDEGVVEGDAAEGFDGVAVDLGGLLEFSRLGFSFL